MWLRTESAWETGGLLEASGAPATHCARMTLRALASQRLEFYGNMGNQEQ